MADIILGFHETKNVQTQTLNEIKRCRRLNASNGSKKSDKDTEMLCFIKKNCKERYPYYVIQCRYRRPEEQKRWLKLRYPSMEEFQRIL